MPATAIAAAATATTPKPIQKPKQLPTPNVDFYGLVDKLNADEKAVIDKIRAYMLIKVPVSTSPPIGRAPD